MKNNNDNILLQQILDGVKETTPDELSGSQVFDYFAADQTLKDYDLSNDEILAGLTDGDGDGGIDGVYVFADESLVDEDFDVSHLPSKYSLDVYMLQNKQETGFGTKTFDKLTVSLPVLLNLGLPVDPDIYSPKLIQRIGIFRDIYKLTARKFPKINFHIVYSAMASTDELDRKVTSVAQSLEELVCKTVGSDSNATIIYQGSRELLNSARKEPARVLDLPFANQTAKTGENSYVALVPIYDYSQFLADNSGRLNKFIFESNVRDFQGSTTVNKAIRETLASADVGSSGADFWWLNNGVTILATQVSIAGGKFIIKDPQIVNGLQTSVSIHNHFKEAPKDTTDSRLVLVKIIESNDEEVRNSVIIATNSQTNLQPTAIRAADNLQRDIEQYFENKGYYYDRRKNHYKNQGKPADLIFAVPYLAQAVLSMGFAEPDQARARPSTLITKNDEYQRIFNKEISMDLYLWMAKMQREIDKRIRQLELSQDFKTNMRFHLSMLVGFRIVGDMVHHPGQLLPFLTNELDLDELLPELAEELNGHLESFMLSNNGYSVDRAAKSKDFVRYLASVGAGITKA